MSLIPDNEVVLDLIAGWASGAVSVTCTQPIDTILTRIQANRFNNITITSALANATANANANAKTKATNAANTNANNKVLLKTNHKNVRSLITKSGLPFLWRGSSAMIGAIPFQNALLMAGYGYGKRWCDNYHSDGNNSNILFGVFVGGCTGGIVQSFLMSPVELIKVNQQVAGKSLASATSLVTTGFFSMNIAWRGLGATLLRDGIPHGVWFASYEFMKQTMENSNSMYYNNIDKEKDASLISLTSGAFAAATAWGVGYPFDIIKTRIQATAPSSEGESKSIIRIAKEIIAESNGRVLAGLYRGFALKLAKAVPSSAINFFVYEKVVKSLSTQ